MQGKEAKSVLAIGAILAFRMLGLFMVLPVFSIAAASIPGSDAALIGMAIGAYGLTQACLQIPFGTLSDRIGRKPIIALGLALFAFGSCVAAMAHTMPLLIFGRALQGAGAIGSTCLALVADLTRDESRTKSMAVIGMTIGLSFCLAIVLGPLVYAHFQLSGIFWLTALLGLAAMLMLFTLIPNPPQDNGQARGATRSDYKAVFTDSELLRMNFSIFTQHAILTLVFLALPIVFARQLHFSAHHQTLFYLCVIALSFVAMLPLVIIGEVKRKLKGVFLFSVLAIAASQAMAMQLNPTLSHMAVILFVFFTAFTLLESILPSLVSKIAPLSLKGTAMGIYSTSQYLGIFAGGVAGGTILHHYGTHGLFFTALALSAFWLLVLLGMAQPPYFSTLIMPYSDEQAVEKIKSTLLALPAIRDIDFSAREQLLYIKVDKHLLDEKKLRNAIENDNLDELKVVLNHQ